MVLDFYDSDYGKDFEAAGDWPDDWPTDIADEGFLCDAWFKAYDTSLKENDEDARLFEQEYMFNCLVRIRWYKDGRYYVERLAKFPARDREDAERLLQAAADALYGEERACTF